MTVLMTGPLIAAAATGSLLALSAALLVAGAATAPTMVTGMTLVQRSTSQGQLNEGMTLAVTAILGGTAAGSATAGWFVERLSPTTGYAVPASAAALALLLCAATSASSKTSGPKNVPETVPETVPKNVPDSEKT